MKNILAGNLQMIPAVTKVESSEELSSANQTEEIVLYDECGDTQWDKVLAQYDHEDQSGEEIKK